MRLLAELASCVWRSQYLSWQGQVYGLSDRSCPFTEKSWQITENDFTCSWFNYLEITEHYIYYLHARYGDNKPGVKKKEKKWASG